MVREEAALSRHDRQTCGDRSAVSISLRRRAGSLDFNGPRERRQNAPAPEGPAGGQGRPRKPMNAKHELIRELKKRGLRDMARKARDGEYSDFGSLNVLPITELVRRLEAAGHLNLAARPKRRLRPREVTP